MDETHLEDSLPRWLPSSGRTVGLFALWPIAVLLVLLVLGIGPYLYLLPIWPMSPDAAMWIGNGRFSNPDWANWVFNTKHIDICYRPLTALSFTLNHAIGGTAPFAYRLTDLTLHVLVAVLLYVLYRRLCPTFSPWGGLVGVAFFLAHPIHDQVLPYLARRSYSLGSLFGLASLIVSCTPDRAAHSGSIRALARAAVAGLFLGCALLSNESWFAAVPLVPLMMIHSFNRRHGSWWRLVVSCTIPLVIASAVFLVRAKVIGGLGGYAIEEDSQNRTLSILQLAWSTVLRLTPLDMRQSSPPVIGLLAILVVVALFYLWGAVVIPMVRLRSPRDRTPGILALWMAGQCVLYPLLGTLYARQLYVFLIPLALLVGVTLGATLSRLTLNSGVRAMVLVPQALLFVWIVLHSPHLDASGPQALRVSCWQRTDRLMHDLYDELARQTDPADIYLAVPRFDRPVPKEVRPLELRTPHERALNITHPAEWMSILMGAAPITVRPYLRFLQDPWENEPTVRFERRRGLPAVVLPPGTIYYDIRNLMFGRKTERGGSITIEVPDTGSKPVYVYMHDGRHGELLRLERPHERGMDREMLTVE